MDVVCRPNDLAQKLGIEPITYRESIKLAFQRIAQNEIVSSWKDSFVSSMVDNKVQDHLTIPLHGCIFDFRKVKITGDPCLVYDNFMSIGGERGWYYGNWLWKLRGDIDSLAGGVGLRRGRTHPTKLEPGDSLDFWRVLAADDKNKRLLLYAEMKLPGEAWLEFSIKDENGDKYLHQKVTFRPHGIFGRAYWYALLPIHYPLFGGMIRRIEGTRLK